MDDWLQIPQGRKRLPIVRLCLILGLTALIYLVVAPKVFAAIVLSISVFLPPTWCLMQAGRTRTGNCGVGDCSPLPCPDFRALSAA